MKNSRNTAGILIMNILCMLLCTSMLIGSTLAWFNLSITDENNKIKVGNLDITIYDVMDGTEKKLVQTTEGENIIEPVLFEGVSWKPGTVAYENLTIQNDGNLAFDYEISLDVTGYNTVSVTVENAESGEATAVTKSLQDVIKVALVEGHITSTEELSIEWTSVEDFQYKGSLQVTGTEEADAAEKKLAVVIYWEPSGEDSAYSDSDFNSAVHTTSDGAPLYLNLGLQFEATQADVETDSFGNTYDAENVQSAVN